MGGNLQLRRADASDRDAIMDLCRASLGWRSTDPDEAFYSWKHDDNSFGQSPTWVAVDDEAGIVGLRVFLRWGFVDRHGARLSAVRAVDTATHPDFQGQGIFSKLTRLAVEELTAEGVDHVFNTPNDKSMPGYLKMGWSQVGAVSAGARIGGPASINRMARARTAAELWSEPTTAGVDLDAMLDADAIEALLAANTATAIRTDRSIEFFRWRYGFEPLRYRAFPLGDSARDGFIVFRVRRRGSATEGAVCDVLAPSTLSGRRLLRAFGALRKEAGVDYLLATSESASLGQGFVALPGMGPMLTWRPLARPGVPELGDLALALGDLELF